MGAFLFPKTLILFAYFFFGVVMEAAMASK